MVKRAALGCALLLFAGFGSLPAQAQVDRDLWFQNSCPHPVRVYLGWTDPKKGAVVNGPWARNAGSPSRALIEAGQPVIHRDTGGVFLYAEATDGSGLEWHGETPLAIAGVTYKMVTPALTVEQGHLTINLTCPAAPVPVPAPAIAAAPPPKPAPAPVQVARASPPPRPLTPKPAIAIPAAPGAAPASAPPCPPDAAAVRALVAGQKMRVSDTTPGRQAATYEGGGASRLGVVPTRYVLATPNNVVDALLIYLSVDDLNVRKPMFLTLYPGSACIDDGCVWEPDQEKVGAGQLSTGYLMMRPTSGVNMVLLRCEYKQ